MHLVGSLRGFRLGIEDVRSALIDAGMDVDAHDVPEEAGDGLVVLFDWAEQESIAALDEGLRNRLVWIGARLERGEGDAMRERLGLLAVVSRSSWNRFTSGGFANFGLYGRPNIAAEAGLESADDGHLRPVGGGGHLPRVLAAYLAAAARIIS